MKITEIENPPAIDRIINAFGERGQAFALDSTQSRYGLGEWSFFGALPFETMASVDLETMRAQMRRFKVEPHPTIPFCGGAVGYFSYDYGRRLEHLPTKATNDRKVADMQFGLYDGVAAYHHRSGRLFLTGCGLSEPASATIKRMQSWLAERTDFEPAGAGDTVFGPWEWNMDERAFCRAVASIRAFIASGDVYQVNLSRRARCPFSGDPLYLYQVLRRGNPAPYSAYLSFPDFSLISTSPEQFLRKTGSQLETRPIKGTVPRGKDAAEDARNEAKLRASEKERAELLMIVDLERNDLGRVAEYGSVRVEDLYQLEHYASVIHQTARIKARLAADRDIFDVIAAAFPGGSITGAPKVRAMEIIEALEPTQRGAYCGSMGYIGFDGSAEFNIAIRSLHVKDGYLDYQVGSGVVWDSDPDSEYQETLDKARAIRETLDRLCQKSR